MYSVRNRGRPNFVFFLFFGARKRLFLAEKDIQIFVFFSFFGIKMAVKKNKKKSVLWLNQCTAGRTLCHLQLHTAAVYIATRRAWVLWGSKQWADSVCCLCCCSWLLSIAPPARKFLSAPPTSAASEQLFSGAGQTYSDRRSSLLGENAENLFLAYWVQYPTVWL